MSTRHEKLVARFITLPMDFTWPEQVRLLEGFGYWMAKGGRTSGSRVRFEHATLQRIRCHRPHPGNIVKPAAMKRLLADLIERGLV